MAIHARKGATGMKTTIHVTYDPVEDCVEGVIGGKPKATAARVPWSDDLTFLYVDERLVGFEIRDFHYFVDFLPFYKLFGPDVVSWLSAFQGNVTAAHHKDRSAFDVDERTAGGRRFEKELATR
jgi:hypothetical protein